MSQNNNNNNDDDDNDNDNTNKNNNDNEENFNTFLDTPFFDPEAYDENDSGPLAWFANLVKNDYESAEALFVGSLCVVLVVITQEMLRMQLYGDGYIPFTTRLGSSSAGHLF